MKASLPKSNIFLGISVILLSLVIGFYSGINFKKSQTPTTQVNETQISEDLSLPTTSPSELPTQGTVTRIIDGDTVELIGGKVVRFVGANAPEVKAPFHDEASQFTQKLLLNQKITLEYEKGYEQDKFGRFLAYVFVGNKNVSIEIVKAGLAKVSIYEKRRKLIYQDQLLEAQTQAQNKKLGIWSKTSKP